MLNRVQDRITEGLWTKRSQGVFFLLNLLLIGPVLLSAQDWIGRGLGWALLAAAFYSTVYKPDPADGCLQKLPVLAVWDVCIWLAVNHSVFLDVYLYRSWSYVLEEMTLWPWAMIGFGLVLCFLPNPAQIWLRVGGVVLAAAGVLQMCAVWPFPLYFFLHDQPEAALQCLLRCGGVWMGLCLVSELTDSELRVRNCWLGILLVVVLTYLALVEQQFLVEVMEYVSAWELPELTGGMAFAGAGVLAALALLICPDVQKRLGPDALGFWAVAWGLVLCRLMLSVNLLGRTWLLVLYGVGCLACLNNEVHQRKTLRLKSLVFLPVLAGVLYLAGRWMSRGLWLNLLLVGICGVLLYKNWDKRAALCNRRGFWLLSMTAMTLCALVYVWRMAFHPDLIRIILVVCLMLMGVMVLLCWPDPTGKQRSWKAKAALCGMMALLYGLATARGGSDIHVQTNWEWDERTEEIQILPQIPNSAVQYNGHSYYLYRDLEVQTWDDLLSFCADRGGYPAVITSMSENQFLFSYMTQRQMAGAYFGLTDAKTEGKWVWADGTASRFTNWHPLEPNADGEDEDYAMFFYEFADGTWNDGSFETYRTTSSLGFLCEWDGYGSHWERVLEAGLPTVRISISARDREDRICAARYQWRTLLGEPIGEEAAMNPYGQDLPIQGDLLTITTVDADGYETRRTVWFPRGAQA